MEKKIYIALTVILMGLSVNAFSSTLLLSNWDSASVDADYAAGDGSAYTWSTTVGLPGTTTAVSKFGSGCLDYRGDSEQLYYNYQDNLSIAKGTFEVWYMPTEEPAVGTNKHYDVMYLDIDTTNYFYLRRSVYTSGSGTYNNQQLAASYKKDGSASGSWLPGGYQSTAGGYLKLNEWHHVALTWDFTKGAGSNELALYVDGTRRSYSTTAANDVWSTLPSRIDIGRAGGYLDSLRISDDVVYSGSSIDVPVEAFTVPEPATCLILGIGLLFARKK